MTRLQLLFRNLRYFFNVNVAVALGVAVATAVLAGALMVGDSVRGSLAELTQRRLGPVDYALVSTRFFSQSLAGRIGAGATPAILITGGARNEVGHDEVYRTADVQIGAVDAAAGSPFDAFGFPVGRGKCITSSTLASELKAAGQANLIFSVPNQSDTPRDAALSRRDRNDVMNDLSASVASIASGDNFATLFNPNATQRTPRNAWVNLKELQDQMEQPGRVNAILASATQSAEDPNQTVAALNEKLKKAITLADYGIDRKAGPTDSSRPEVGFVTRETYFFPPAVDAAQRAAKAANVTLRRVSINLLNSLTNVSAVDAKAVIHYAVSAGIDSLDDATLGRQEVAINQWTADQLKAKVGDKIAIDFYLRQAGGDLGDASKSLPSDRLTFIIKAILPMTGLGADPTLSPNYKGLTDANSVADWDPPAGLTINKKLVTKADEDYWHTYRAAPKIFFNFEAARKLWGGVYGDVTGLRVPAADADRFAKAFLAELDPKTMGLAFRPIKAEQLAAARGGTDFAMFFVMFSFFLIVAAALLTAMLMRLNVEQRARQLGLLTAVGFTPRSLRGMALREGAILSVIGSIIGLGLGIGYTSLIMLGLRTWWIGAVGTTSMSLRIEPLTLVYGFVGSLCVAMPAVLWAAWRIGKAQPARLLAGGFSLPNFKTRTGRLGRAIAIVLVIGGLGLIAAAVAGKMAAEAGFGGGAMILIAALFWLGAVLRPRRHQGASFVGQHSLLRLGIRNASRHTARGVLSVGLIAFAAFTLITVAALKQEGSAYPEDRHSETGGYRLILTAGIPLTGDLNTVKGREILGFRAPADPIYNDVHFTPLRQWAGQDISCLNLTKPNSPTILGVPHEMIERGGFVPGDTMKTVDSWAPPTGVEKGWALLESEGKDESIPVMVDSDTLEYVLQTQIGDFIEITDQLGVQRKLKLVASLQHSIFQGQLLMADSYFRKLFPARSGFGAVLVDAPAAQSEELARKLASELGDFSVSVETTTARLAGYQKVQNTYLETFQTLGALGLMLGTLGLAVVLVRTVFERRGELALLASIGFTAASRVKLVLAENTFLLILGLLLGTVSALAGIAAAVVRESRPINALSLAIALLSVLIVGLASSSIAVGLTGVHTKPADLRRE